MLIANQLYRKGRGKLQEQEAMTISDKADFYATPKVHSDRKRPEYGFILTLVCLALTLAVASAKLTPAAIGSGLNNDETLTVGP